MQPASAGSNRRQWLAQTAGLTALAAAASPFAATAAGPITSRHAPKFKLSLAAYSYRSLLQDHRRKMRDEGETITLKEFIDDCAKLQLEGTELTSYYFPAEPSVEYLHDLKAHAFRQGLTISGTAIGNDFGFPPGPERDQQLADTKAWIERAAHLGAPVIRVFAGHQKKNSTPEQTHRLMVEGLQEACELAGKHGVFLALENHGGPTATAEGLLKIVHDVESDWFGVNLDSGNFHSDDIYGELASIAPYALNVQVKVVVSGPDKVKRPTDFPRLLEILEKANYRGFVVLEYEEGGDPREECARYVEELRQLMA